MFLRDMTSPEGAFISAEDADSEGQEGLFYVWTPEESPEASGSQTGESLLPFLRHHRRKATSKKAGASRTYILTLGGFATEKKMEPANWKASLDESRRSSLQFGKNAFIP